MASTEAVARCLSIIKHLPSDGPLTAESVTFYALGCRELTDAELEAATARAVSSCTFRPQPAELVKLSGYKPALPDVNGIVARLRGMCDYHPNYGTSLPSVERVRAELGDAIADAYGYIGPKRLESVVFGGEGVGADIAAREFGEHLLDAQKVGANVSLPAPVARPMLAAPSITLYGERPDSGFKKLGSATH